MVNSGLIMVICFFHGLIVVNLIGELFLMVNHWERWDMLGTHRLIDILNGDSLILDTQWNLLTYLMGLTLWESNVAMGNARSK